MKDLIIIGGGGHTRVLIGMAQAAGLNVRGVVTQDRALLNTDILGVPVLGIEGDVAFDPAEVDLLHGVGNVASRKGSGLGLRADIYARYATRGFMFRSLVSASAIIQPHVTLGEGVQVMPGAVVQTGTMLGENVIINTRASIDHDVSLAPHCHVAPGAVLCGQVEVGERTHIGAGAVIIQCVRIGMNAVIGAGAVVTRHVPDNTVVHAADSTSARMGVA